MFTTETVILISIRFFCLKMMNVSCYDMRYIGYNYIPPIQGVAYPQSIVPVDCSPPWICLGKCRCCITWLLRNTLGFTMWLCESPCQWSAYVPGLFPAILNLASNAMISSNATCGEPEPEVYCKLVEHVPGRRIKNPHCPKCDANSILSKGATLNTHRPL